MSLSAMVAMFLLVQSASFEGVILRAGSGDPIPGAEVTLSRMTAPDGTAGTTLPALTPMIVTKGDGKFVFKDLEPGSYRIAVARNGYVKNSGEGTSVSLANGQVQRDIVIRLTPTGNINGRVSDSSGEPLAGVRVQLLQSAYDEGGKRTLRPIGLSRTNDRGEYRLYWVTPGRYYLNAGGGNPDQRQEGASPNEIKAKPYPPTYYPGAVDAARAQTIEVLPGAELDAIDVVLRSEQQYRISGRVIDAGTGRPAGNVELAISPRQPDAAFGFSVLNRKYTPSTGEFEFRNLSPGAYWVHATTSFDENSAIAPEVSPRTVTEMFLNLLASRSAGHVAVDIFGSDVEGLVLPLTSGVSFPGVLRVEGRELSTLEGAASIEVALIPMGPNEYLPLPRPMRPDGAFSLANVSLGEYRVRVANLPRDVYVKEARFDAVDVLRQPLVISGRTTASLAIMLSPNGGQIDGTLVNAQSCPVSGSLAVLVPDQYRDRTDLFKTALTDQNGHFIFRGIPPGEYKVFAWEAIDEFAYFDPDFLRQSEQKGKPVTILESSKVTAEVTIIPSTQ